MEQKEFVAALDLGTSKMLIMAASKHSNGTLLVLGEEKIPSGDCIRRGCVYNIGETATNVQKLIARLDLKLRPGIKKIYVGIGGQSLHTEYYSVKKEINGLITEETLAYLRSECEKYQPEEVLTIFASEYYVDGHFDANPGGVVCKEIEAKFQLILGRPSRSLQASMEKAGIEVAGYFISPLATAEAVLTDREKELGCVLMEFGAGITYLSIYKGGLLKLLLTIPLGGNVITKDLGDLKVSEAEAEVLKIKEGNALPESEKEEQLLDTIVEARVNEIIANVIEQIKQSGYEKELSAGIIITGGGSLLKNLDKLLERETKLTVRKADGDPTQSCILGLLSLGKENCAEKIKKIEPEVEFVEVVKEKDEQEIEIPYTPKQPKKSLFDRVAERSKRVAGQVSNDLFGGYDSNGEQKNAEKK